MAIIVKTNDKTGIDRINLRLEEVGFTDQYLVEAIPLECDTLHHYLSGKKPFPTGLLLRIADMLSVNVKWLSGEEQTKC
ncbi:MAG: hypothetical protein DHS20C07_22370 [Methyloligella sp.]|jgi:hypothetical protein|nr:MAG: hypothetical protein DHS20C07_22370 [Methyloligella sp.]